ncbi:phage tail protein [Photobacterium halotolerans]|uniref:Phage tail protein n=1 Tax=Photobacterium halotolerans TaxID=265726 RepID=A0A7X4Y0N8_9GAMM|nr:tail fiber protein [Photobacterium halotolerans]NAW64119.1 phage tail protein [Photobacterium halotolerans]NAW85313.1 phage tail protein [Photobacterium halotolerans]NAX48777.1 phage tail protein [Photobacterium halotolerans]
MSTRYLSEITLFAGSYAPVQWAYCTGTLLPITNNEALYSLLGITNGGDGRTNFALPDLQGRVPVGMGQGTGLTRRTQGQKIGQETVQLTVNNLPNHSHGLQASATPALSPEPSAALVLGQANQYFADPDAGDLVEMQQAAIASTGDGRAHSNMAPSLALNFIICTAGVYPSQS